jgi:hypothetical protein
MDAEGSFAKYENAKQFTEYCPMALFAKQCRYGVRLDWDLNPTHVVSRVHNSRKSMGEYLV